jgi:hypothetical protein
MKPPSGVLGKSQPNPTRYPETSDSAKSSKKAITLCHWGSAMEHETTKFFYHGQDWEVELPVLPQLLSGGKSVCGHDV